MIASRVCAFIFLTGWCVGVGVAQTSIIGGTISDQATGGRLAAANVRILGTPRGTVANSEGVYSFALETGENAIVFSYLGYEPETLRVMITGNLQHDVRLKPSAIRMAEVVVIAEDPAVAIIRKAIANKRKWMNLLNSYRFEAFTRQVLRRDTAIASIAEAYTTGVMAAGDTLREVVRQKRQTENIPLDENFAAVRSIVNFNEDEIRLFSMNVNNVASAYTFIGPTAPDALEYYDYKLLSTEDVSGVEVYKIRMTPTTRLRPLFDGTITIADGTFAVMGVDLKPNEAFTLPFTKDFRLRYRQEFALYDSVFWMPTNIRITGNVAVSFIGFSIPPIGLEITSTLYDYSVNPQIPDSVLHKQRLTIDSSAASFDSTFWKTHNVLPLTAEEQSAYKSLDSSQTLEKQFQPTGPLTSLGGDDNSLSMLQHVDARFNRVEGFFFGGKFDLDSVTSFTRFLGRAGYGFSDNRFKFSLGAEVFTSPARRFGLGLELHRELDHTPDGGFYEALFNSFTALIDKNDYRDYFLAQGWRAYATISPSEYVDSKFSYIDEEHSSLANITDYDFFSRSTAFRPNPPIAQGTLRSIKLDFRLGQRPVPLDLVTRNALHLSVEYSSPSLGKSSFSFLQMFGSLTMSMPTFARNMLFPAALRIRLSSGVSGGSIPPQRYFTLDTRSSGYAPFGVLRGASVKEFAGDRFVMMNLEHNFRNLPFLALDIPFLYRNNIELILQGSVAQAWLNDRTTTDGWYSEIGVGISRIFDIIRADMTYRLTDPRQAIFTLCAASIL